MYLRIATIIYFMYLLRFNLIATVINTLIIQYSIFSSKNVVMNGIKSCHSPVVESIDQDSDTKLEVLGEEP